MNIPPLCLHHEISTRLTSPTGPSSSLYHTFFVDWEPTKDVGPFSMGVLALEAIITSDALREAASDDSFYNKHAHWSCTVVYHTAVKPNRPHRRRDGIERISRECRWQEGADMDPDHYPVRKSGHWAATTCYEGALGEAAKKHLLGAYLAGGKPASFAFLTSLWGQVFKDQYKHFLKLTRKD